MTQKQIDNAKQILNEKIREVAGIKNLCGWKKILEDKGMMKELFVLENEDRELSARELINSCLCYGSDYFEPTNRWIYEKQAYGVKSYAEEDAELLVGGMTRVRELFEEQKADFEKATVLTNVHMDSEGLYYNSIVWADEVEG